MTDLKPVKIFEVLYGKNWRIDLMRSVKGLYADLYSISNGTDKLTNKPIKTKVIYDSTIDGNDAAVIIADAVAYIRKKVGNHDLVYSFTNFDKSGKVTEAKKSK